MRLSIVRHEVVVGWFLAVTLLVTGGGLALKARSTGMVGSTELWLVVPDGLGLQPGAPVTMRGIQVGEAADVTFDDEGQVRIGCRIKDEFMRFVRDDSEAEVVAPPVIGTTKVVLYPGASAQVAQAGQALRVRPSTSLLDRVDAVGVKVERLLERIDVLVSTSETAVKRVSEITDQVQRGEGLVSRLINDPELAARADKLVGSADEAFTRLKGPTLDRVDAALDRINATMDQAEHLVVEMRSDDGRVSRLIQDVQGAIKDVRETLRAVGPEATAASLRDAAEALRATAEDGGRVARHVDPVLERLQTTLAAIEQASTALQQLAREVGRQPNSVIFGREPPDGPGLRR